MRPIKKDYYFLIGATMLLYLALGAIIVVLYTTNHERAREGSQAHAAICLLDKNLKTRVHDSRIFLKNHPNGFLDISARDIQRSIDNQQATINALKVAKCEGKP